MWEQLARTSAGTLIAYKLATGGLKRGSLQRDGAAAAFVVGLLSFSCSIRCGVTLLFFYKSGSMLTRVGADVKPVVTRNRGERRSRRGQGKPERGT